jgi:D-alanine-D-alanine ligase
MQRYTGTTVGHKVAIVYNEPIAGRYGAVGEERAILAIRDDVKIIHQSLVELGHSVAEVPLLPPFAQAADTLRNLDADVIFNLFEGFEDHPETEATVTHILEGLHVPCTGCPSSALALALDKARAKAMMEESGIPTPRHQLLSPETLSKFNLDYPCIVKPSREDASHGLSEDSVVRDYSSLQERVALVTTYFGGMALVEEFLEGREFNATVLHNSEEVVLPISEIIYSLPPNMPEVLTYAAKWDPNSMYFKHTNAVCPAQIGAEEQAHIVEIAVTVFRLMVGHGYARVDMRMDAQGKINVLEVNPNPDISPDAGSSRQAQAAGMSYSQFISEILTLAFQRQRT